MRRQYARKRDEETTYWLSYSDMMAGLLLCFVLIIAFTVLRSKVQYDLKVDELNEKIQKYAIGWDVNRISRLARSIMQLAIFEIQFVEDVPTGVAIAEAVRIAKLYDGDDTGAFVNGILGAFAKSLPTEVI